MAIIPPRRNEFLTKEGIPTTRFAEYLERITSVTNSTETDVDLISSIRPMVLEAASKSELVALEMVLNLALNQLSALDKKLDNMALMSAISGNPETEEIRKIANTNSLIVSVNPEIEALKKRIETLEAMTLQG